MDGWWTRTIEWYYHDAYRQSNAFVVSNGSENGEEVDSEEHIVRPAMWISYR